MDGRWFLRPVVKSMSPGQIALREQFRLRLQPVLDIASRRRTLVYIAEVRPPGHFVRGRRKITSVRLRFRGGGGTRRVLPLFVLVMGGCVVFHKGRTARARFTGPPAASFAGVAKPSFYPWKNLKPKLLAGYGVNTPGRRQPPARAGAPRAPLFLRGCNSGQPAAPAIRAVEARFA